MVSEKIYPLSINSYLKPDQKPRTPKSTASIGLKPPLSAGHDDAAPGAAAANATPPRHGHGWISSVREGRGAAATYPQLPAVEPTSAKADHYYKLAIVSKYVTEVGG